jgi:hypothetical protein
MRYELTDDEWATLTSLDKTKQRPPPCSCQRGSDRDALARASAEHPNSGDSKMATGDWGRVRHPHFAPLISWEEFRRKRRISRSETF